MALKVPDSFVAEARTAARAKPYAEEPSLFRLAPHHRETLRDVAEGAEESDVGLCCSYLYDAASGEGRDYDDCALNPLEAYAESALTFDYLGELFGVARVRSWRERVRRARRTIALLRAEGNGAAADVLMVFYGHPDPIARSIPELRSSLGSFASLARYTEAVEDRRRELVRETALRDAAARRFLDIRDEEVLSPDERRALERAKGGDRYREGGDLRDLAGGGERANLFAELVDLARRRALLEKADRSVSSADALREALAPFAEPLPAKLPEEGYAAFEARNAARKARREAHVRKTNAFLLELRLETARLLAAAERAYHEAWLRSAAKESLPNAERVLREDAAARRGRRHNREMTNPNPTSSRVRGAGWSSS